MFAFEEAVWPSATLRHYKQALVGLSLFEIRCLFLFCLKHSKECLCFEILEFPGQSWKGFVRSWFSINIIFHVVHQTREKVFHHSYNYQEEGSKHNGPQQSWIRVFLTKLEVFWYGMNRRLISSVGTASVCCAGGRGFEPQTGPTLRVLK